jgi:N-acylneuraminate cytidylyltransferase
MPFLTEEQEGTDINDPEDWWYVQHLLQIGAAQLPAVEEVPFADDSMTGLQPDQ